MSVSIRIAGNTTLPILLAIRAKGYKIDSFYLETQIGDLETTYEAEKEGYQFGANDPEELLGLIAMWEMRGDNWQHNPEIESDIRSELIDSAIVYDNEGNIVNE